MSVTKRLVRFSLTEAAAQLSLTTTTLKKLLRGKAIEPSGAGGYTLKELVRAMTPGEGDTKQVSLRAHGRLQESNARLVEHQLAEREGRFIEREEALSYLRSVMNAVYWSVYRLELSKEEEEQVTRELQAAATEYWLRHGWALAPQFTFSQNGQAEPLEAENRRLLWRRASNVVLASVATNGEDDGRAKDHTDAGRASAGARRHRVRHH